MPLFYKWEEVGGSKTKPVTGNGSRYEMSGCGLLAGVSLAPLSTPNGPFPGPDFSSHRSVSRESALRHSFQLLSLTSNLTGHRVFVLGNSGTSTREPLGWGQVQEWKVSSHVPPKHSQFRSTQVSLCLLHVSWGQPCARSSGGDML